MDPIALPTQLQSHADLLVDQALKGLRVPHGPAFDLVTSWCETVDDGSTVRAGGSASFPLVTLAGAAARARDDDIRLHADQSDDAELPDSGQVTDEMRIAAVRRHLRQLLAETDFTEDLPTSACAVLIEASDGRRAVLCYELSGDWDPISGPDIEWEGVWPSLEDWRREHVERGAIMTTAEVDALDDETVLAAWRKIHIR